MSGYISTPTRHRQPIENEKGRRRILLQSGQKVQLSLEIPEYLFDTFSEWIPAEPRAGRMWSCIEVRVAGE